MRAAIEGFGEMDVGRIEVRPQYRHYPPGPYMMPDGSIGVGDQHTDGDAMLFGARGTSAWRSETRKVFRSNVRGLETKRNARRTRMTAARAYLDAAWALWCEGHPCTCETGPDGKIDRTCPEHAPDREYAHPRGCWEARGHEDADEAHREAAPRLDHGREVKRLRAELAQAKREYRDAMAAVALHSETIGLLQTQRDEAREELAHRGVWPAQAPCLATHDGSDGE